MAERTLEALGGAKRRRGPWSGLRRRESIAGFLFLLPNFLTFFVFTLFPVLAALFLTFAEWDLATPPRWIGLGNFAKMAKDDLFIKTMGNTFYYTFTAVPTGVLLAFILALLLNRKMRGILTFRTIFFLPNVTLAVAVAIVWSWIYHPEFGLINYFLSRVGIKGPQWLFDSRYSMPAVIIMSNWAGIGYPMLIYLAALQGIPAELYEAATIDGAGGWQQLRHVTIPLISPATFFILTTSLIGAFQGFDQFYMLTQGGPAFSTTTIVLYIFNNGFSYFKMGYATGMAAVLFLCILTITLLGWQARKAWVYGAAEM